MAPGENEFDTPGNSLINGLPTSVSPHLALIRLLPLVKQQQQQQQNQTFKGFQPCSNEILYN